MNDLDKKIKKWKKELKKNPSFEESDILEMESHLLLLIEEYQQEGKDETSAFELAVERFGALDKVGGDVFKVRTTKVIPRASWQESSWIPLLIRNYIKTLGRNIYRNKFYTSLNLVGLSIGMVCCLLIILFVKDELSFDRHHINADRVYRVTLKFNVGSGNHWAPIGPPVAKGMKDAIPEIEETVRFFRVGGNFNIFNYQNEKFKATKGVYADSSVFKVFTYPLLHGNPETALIEPRSIVLSSEMAQAFFGNENPIGKTIEVTDWDNFQLTVTGVLDEMPKSTHFPFNYLLSMSTFYDFTSGPDWDPDQSLTWAGIYTYILLNETAEQAVVQSKLPGFMDNFYARIAEEDMQPSEMATMILQPLPDIHLHSSLEKEYEANSDMTYVYVFGVIAIFVLLIACSNFINLTTARASNRMREIGIRKTLGAVRSQLALQFLGESILLSFLALVLAYGLAVLMLPLLNQITGKSFTIESILTAQIIWSFISVALFAGIISGIYPAIYMSGFSPVKVLKGLTPNSSNNAFLRKGLVVFQFAISMFLIIGTTVVFNQLGYLRSEQMGFDKEGVINIPLFGEFEDVLRQNSETIKQELLRNPDIISVAMGGDYPGKRFSVEAVIPEGRSDDEEISVRIADDGVDHDFIPTMGINLVEGRNFSKQGPTDSTAWIINQEAVKKLELEEPIGHILNWGSYSGPIIGVVENFNYASLHTQVEALVLPLLPNRGNYLFVRTQAKSVNDVLSFLDQEVKKFAPSAVFEYSFLSEEFDKLYRSEDQMSSVFWYFSFVAILIACMGLFGLSTFMINQRAKEIGVRKVMGASIRSILMLVSWNFVKLVGIAFVLSVPIVYLVMSKWLSSFAYKTSIELWMFIGAGVLVLIISLLTIGFQTFKSAISNPVKALRSE